MTKEVEKNIPVMFQKLSSFETEDTRFVKVKIWLMHLEENLNSSFFSKESVEKAIPSLANTPILAYIEENSVGEIDFSDHRIVLNVKNGEFQLKYLGQAIGVIPEINNAQFEMRLCDDGIEREFLTCEGLIWTKWDTPTDIFNRDLFKSQSMELDENYSGEFKEDGLFHFTEFKFFGACALGTDVKPAMVNSTIELQFTESDIIYQEIQNKMEQFKIYTNSSKGGNNVDEKNLLLEKYNFTLEQLQEKEINFEEISLEELEVKLQEFSSEEDKIEEPKKEFSLSMNQLEDEIRKELRKDKVIMHDYWGEPFEEQKFYFIDIKDGVAIVIDSSWESYFGVPFSESGDSVILDFENMVGYVADWRPRADGDTVFSLKEIKDTVKEFVQSVNKKQELEDTQNKFTALEEEVIKLREFKQNIETEQRKLQESEVYEKFTSQLSEEEIASVKENAFELTIEQIEEKLFALVGKKNAQFSDKTNKPLRLKFDVGGFEKEEKPYGGLFDKFL